MRPIFLFDSGSEIVSVVGAPMFSGMADDDGTYRSLTKRFVLALAPPDRETLRAFCAAPFSVQPAENVLLLSVRRFYFYRAVFLEKEPSGIRATLFTDTTALYENGSPYTRLLELPRLLEAIPALSRTLQNGTVPLSPHLPFCTLDPDGLCGEKSGIPLADAPCLVSLPVFLDWFGKATASAYREIPCRMLLPENDAEYTLPLPVKPLTYLLFAIHAYLYQIADAHSVLYGTLQRVGGEITLRFQAVSAQIPETLWLCDNMEPLAAATPHFRNLLYYIQYLLHTQQWQFTASYVPVKPGVSFSIAMDCGSEDWETLDFKYSAPTLYGESLCQDALSVVRTLSPPFTPGTPAAPPTE